MITAAAVFAAVLSRTFSSVVKEASVSDDLVNEALEKGQVESPRVPLNPARVSGQVVSSTSGDGIAGVQAELFSAATAPCRSRPQRRPTTARSRSDRLGEGTYRVRFSGAGFGELWYPGGRVFTEGADVAVAEAASVARPCALRW